MLPPFRTLTGLIGIGASDADTDSWSKILQAFKDLGVQYKDISLAIYAKKTPLKPRQIPSRVSLKISPTPESELLRDLKAGNIKGAIRGSLSSIDFLKHVSQEFSASQISRIALLESASGHQFWLAPVGIDEGITYESRLEFIEHAIVLLEKCRVPPNIGILSKGRMGDAKRGAFIKESLDNNQRLVQEITKRYPSITIAHDEILLENAISKQRNFVLAPDGVSGNLIYRTLVHLGNGRAYGAVYCGTPFEKFTIIDTSRVGNLEEIEGAMILALAF
jgi:predicted methyltransferase MtxX (methanogen marker protein 4)